jgi:FkbM family methyltransferase
MELESSNLINVQKSKLIKNAESFSYEKDMKQLTNFLRTILGLINICILIIALFIFLFKNIDFGISFNFSFFSNQKEDLAHYQNIQNNFCDNIRLTVDKNLEEKIMLYNISLNKTNFDMFIYNSYDYLSYQIQLNQSLQAEATLKMLEAVQYFADKYDFENDDIAIIDIGANVGWYTTFFGYFKYTVLSFESLPENNYILRKNYCRNNRDFFGPLSTITIINEVLYPIETFCDYYKDLKNAKKNLVLCDKSKEKNLDKDYIKIDRVKATKLSNFIPLITNKRVTLIRLDLEYEGEMAIMSGKELINKYHIPYVFMEFNMLMFALHETRPQDFLRFFTENGYRISLKGFLSNEFISVEDIMRIKFITINLYLVFVGK